MGLKKREVNTDLDERPNGTVILYQVIISLLLGRLLLVMDCICRGTIRLQRAVPGDMVTESIVVLAIDSIFLITFKNLLVLLLLVLRRGRCIAFLALRLSTGFVVVVLLIVFFLVVEIRRRWHQR